MEICSLCKANKVSHARYFPLRRRGCREERSGFLYDKDLFILVTFLFCRSGQKTKRKRAEVGIKSSRVFREISANKANFTSINVRISLVKDSGRCFVGRCVVILPQDFKGQVNKNYVILTIRDIRLIVTLSDGLFVDGINGIEDVTRIFCPPKKSKGSSLFQDQVPKKRG